MVHGAALGFAKRFDPAATLAPPPEKQCGQFHSILTDRVLKF
jgi:hypothetical protein